MVRAHPFTARAFPWVFGILLALLCGFLLERSFFMGSAHGTDTMIYARSLWGVAHGDFFNSVRGRPTFLIHGQFVFFVLAPFVWVANPVRVLIWAQAASCAVTVALFCNAFARRWMQVHRSDGTEARAAIGVPLSIAATFCISPIILNPFVFDPRPDIIGVPLFLAALLRLWETRKWDAYVLLLCAAATLCREEYAILTICGLVVLPSQTSWRARIAVALVLATYFGLLWLIPRWSMIKPNSVPKVSYLTGFLDPPEPPTLHDVIRYKGELLLAFAFCCFPYAWKAWRWLLVAAFPVAYLTLTRSLLPFQLTMHHTFFAIAPWLAACVIGIDRVKPKKPLLALSIASTFGLYAMSATAPFGGRFEPRRYDLRDEDGGFRWAFWERDPKLVAVHEELDRIPDDVPLIIDSLVGARFANRDFVIPENAVKYLPILSRADGRTIEPHWVALSNNHWPDRSEILLRSGFRVAGYRTPKMVLFTRDPRHQHTPWERIANIDTDCANAELTFPEAGIELCRVALREGKLVVLARRVASPSSPRAAAAVFLIARIGTENPVPIRLWNGLATLSELPSGKIVRLESARPIGAMASVDLVDSFGVPFEKMRR